MVGTEADPTPQIKEDNEILAIVVSSINTAKKNRQIPIEAIRNYYLNGIIGSSTTLST